ncbi:hypothetical protein BGZ46_003463 [Entomortierella lignicola]|nr:hypothetical protein BGZ46_003463 [Entomortierella lignicola]
MFGFDNNHDEVYGTEGHKSHWTHELIAGAAAFEATKKYQEAHPGGSHNLSKEILAGLAAAEADKLFESKGLDFIDKEKAKHQAKKNAELIYDQQFAN